MVTWSVQEYACRARTLWSMCMLMHELSGWVFKAWVRIIHSDGANVMLGARNSVMSRLRCEQPALVALHCHCHIAALIANEACKVLPDELEDLTTDVWNYFQKSPRRLRQFEEFQSFVECKPHKLLKACPTWWLSLEACVNRLIEQYEAWLCSSKNCTWKASDQSLLALSIFLITNC